MTGAGRRALGFWMCLALVMGNMIGAGVFLLPAGLAPFGWNAVAGWVLTIGGALALAAVFAALARLLPEAGGPVGQVGVAFGPIAAFAIGWIYWVSTWTANVTIAVAAVSYASLFLPGIAHIPNLPAWLALGLLWMLTLVNLRGARTAGWVQLVTLIAKLMPLAVVGVLIVGVLMRHGGAALSPFPREGFSGGAVTAAAALTLFALLGFECASLAVDKVDRPALTIPRATLAGTALTGLIYLLICSGIALMLPPDLVATSDAPFALFVERYWSPGPALFVGLFAAVSAIGALNGWILIQGEVPLAMARAGTLPAWFGVTDARGTPVRALIVASLCASVLLIANSSRSMGGLFTYMALLSTSATLWLYLACALAALRLKVARPVAAIGTVYALWTLWGAGIAISGLSLVLMAAGLPLYYWVRKRAAASAP
jgi:basic amino acid/polyamine antiporter, APA family